MIEINLLPEEIRKKKRAPVGIDVSKLDIQNIPLLNMAVAAIAGLIAIQIFLFITGMADGVIFNILDKEYKRIMPEKQEADRIQTQLDRMGNKVAAIDELMVKRFSWTKKLNTLSDSMTPGIWLSELEYEEKLVERPRAVSGSAAKNKNEAASKRAVLEKVLARNLIVSGVASSMGEEGTALIGRFIKALKSNDAFYADFSDIELGTIKREKVQDQEVMNFKITCPFKAK